MDNFEDCLKLKRGIDPIIIWSQVILHNQESFKSSLKQFSTWTHSTDKLLKIFSDFCKDPNEYALAGFLQLMSILEFALGNVYKSITRQLPPHLLKDVIDELTKVECFAFNQVAWFFKIYFNFIITIKYSRFLFYKSSWELRKGSI